MNIDVINMTDKELENSIENINNWIEEKENFASMWGKVTLISYQFKINNTMKNRTLNLARIRHFLYAVLVAVFIISCSNEQPKQEVKTIIVNGNDTIKSRETNGKIYSIDEIANMKAGEMIYIEVCGSIRRAKVLKNDINKELIWYKRANYFEEINDLSITEIKQWSELP